MVLYEIEFSASWYVGIMGYFCFASTEEDAVRKFNKAHEGCELLGIKKSNLLKGDS